MVKTDRLHHEAPGHLSGRQLLEGQGWRLPSGVALSHFALRSGFLTSRLWDEAQAWGSRPVAGGRSQPPLLDRDAPAVESRESKQ